MDFKKLGDFQATTIGTTKEINKWNGGGDLNERH